MPQRQCLDCKVWVETDDRWAEFWCDECRKVPHCIICDGRRATTFCEGCWDGFCEVCQVEHNFAECESDQNRIPAQGRR